jgi:diketogulonate reductase-like aldo/keto reductase
MRATTLPDGRPLPVLGLGTWRYGETAGRRSAEVAAIRAAIDLGYRLFDTAEMYGEGGAESVLGTALTEALRAGAVEREALFIVSKVYPQNATRGGILKACDASRKRLGLDRIDAYLLHWRGGVPLTETVAGLQAQVDAGHVGRWGVSNFDTDDLAELDGVLARGAGGAGCATNQVYYSLSERGPEVSLLPSMRDRSMPLMAYSPIDQGALAGHRVLADVGAARSFSAAQVALAWIVGQPGVVAIPKASSLQHLQDNLAAADSVLDDADRARIDAAFPAPKRKTPLAML